MISPLEQIQKKRWSQESNLDVQRTLVFETSASANSATPAFITFIKTTLLTFSMYPLKHIISSLILCVILFPFIKYYTILVFLAAVFIDTDHWLFYVFRESDYSTKSFKRAYYYCRKHNIKDALHILHVVEFWALIAILSFFYKFFFIIFIGIVFHVWLDVIYLWFHPEFKDGRTYSLITWLYRHKSKRNTGILDIKTQ